ncbi:MAG: hypothetical protein ACQESN_08730 [Thermotogota bacterium]
MIRDDNKVGYEGFELKDFKSKKVYFVPSEIIHQMPFKITQSKKIIFRGKVYHLVIGTDSKKMEADDTLDTKTLVDYIFPAKHTSSDDLLLCKLICILTATTKSFFRISTRQGFGKDAVANNIISLVGHGTNVGDASAAKLATLIDEWFTYFNEVSGYAGAERDELQKFFLRNGDPKNNTYQHKTTGSEVTYPVYDTSNYGFTVFYNLPSYYMNKGIPFFDTMFLDSVLYRIFPVLLKGQVNDPNFVNAQYDARQIIIDNIEDYKKVVGKLIYLRDNLADEVVKFDLSKYNFKVSNNEEIGRWNTQFINFAKIVQLYTDFKEKEFYKIMDLMYSRHKDYIKELEKYNIFE